MLNSNTLENSQKNLEFILNHPDNKLLIQALEKFKRTVKHYGYEVQTYSLSALNKLSEISPEKKSQITVFFENWAKWIEPESEDLDPLEIDVVKEKVFLKRALEHYGLWVSDEFMNTIQEGQIIEFYGPELIQLYRNIKFFDYCSYSLLDISVFEFYNLWERPAYAMNMTLDDAKAVLMNPIPIMPMKAPPHILRETKPVETDNEHLRFASLVHFHNVGSLFKGVNPVPAGVISTSSAEVIAVGDEAKSIHFV